MKTRKTYVLSPEVIDEIEHTAARLGLRSGAAFIEKFVYEMIHLDKEIKKEVSGTLKAIEKSLPDNENDEFFFDGTMAKREQLELLEGIFEQDDKEDSSSGTSMKVVRLKHGEVVFPKSWIEVNPEEAPESLYAYVFEGRNGDKYNVPHFIIYTDINYYDTPRRDTVIDELYDFVRNYNDDTKAAFSNIVAARHKNPDGSGPVMNVNEYLDSFEPGAFEIPVKGTKSYNRMYMRKDPPYGAKILRPEGYDLAQDEKYLGSAK